MLKNTLFGLLLSILIIIFLREFGLFIKFLVLLHNDLAWFLGKIFAGGYAANLIRHTLALFLIPFIPGFIVWVLSHRRDDYFAYTFWGLWLALAAALAIH